MCSRPRATGSPSRKSSETATRCARLHTRSSDLRMQASCCCGCLAFTTTRSTLACLLSCLACTGSSALHWQTSSWTTALFPFLSNLFGAMYNLFPAYKYYRCKSYHVFNLVQAMSPKHLLGLQKHRVVLRHLVKNAQCDVRRLRWKSRRREQ